VGQRSSDQGRRCDGASRRQAARDAAMVRRRREVSASSEGVVIGSFVPRRLPILGVFMLAVLAVLTFVPAALAWDGNAEGEVQWALQWVGQSSWQGPNGWRSSYEQCEKFVENAWNTEYVETSALTGWNRAVNEGRAHRGDANAPRGALVYWNCYGSYGHVGISVGGGQHVDAGSSAIQLGANSHHTSYLGWATAPSSWPGRADPGAPPSSGSNDLVFIKTINTGTNTIELHAKSAASGYKTSIIATGTGFSTGDANNGWFSVANIDGDGRPDLVFIKTKNTGTKTVELHVKSAASGYRTSIIATGTGFSTADASNGFFSMANIDGDGRPDLVFIKTRNMGTNTVELHAKSAASGYRTSIIATGTGFSLGDAYNGGWFSMSLMP